VGHIQEAGFLEVAVTGTIATSEMHRVRAEEGSATGVEEILLRTESDDLHQLAAIVPDHLHFETIEIHEIFRQEILNRVGSGEDPKMGHCQLRLRSQKFNRPLIVAGEGIADELEEIGITTGEAEEASMRSEKPFALEAAHTTVHGTGTGSEIRKQPDAMMTQERIGTLEIVNLIVTERTNLTVQTQGILQVPK